MAKQKCDDCGQRARYVLVVDTRIPTFTGEPGRMIVFTCRTCRSRYADVEAGGRRLDA